VTTEHDAMRDAAGAWVLGALDEEETWSFRAHLEVCAACRDEVERLRVAADALPVTAPPVEPPPELKQRLMAIVEAEARDARKPAAQPRREGAMRGWLRGLTARPAFAAAAAALLLLVGGGLGVALSGGGEDSQTVALTVDSTKLRGASAELVRSGDATQVRVRDMPQPPRGRVYQVWIKKPGSAPAPDAVFTVDREGRGAVGVIGDVEGAEAVLVTDEPQGGSQVPSRQPVVQGRPA
jgi:anti-sigma-K factor RskA